MSNAINRNPWAMLDYANSLDKSIETIESALLNTVHKLDIYVEDLDSKSKAAVEQFHEDYKKIEAQLEAYSNLSKMIRTNANALIELHENTRF